MFMKLLLAALLIASVIAGVLSAAADGWSPNSNDNSQLYQSHRLIQPSSL
jgi:archaellum component FlaG (FlaF/FlaG flagellin family)